MSRVFYYHVGLSVLLFAGLFLLANRLASTAQLYPRLFPFSDGNPTHLHVGALLLSPVLLYFVARLSVRVTGSERPRGFLTLYAVAVSLPIFAAVAGSFRDVAVFGLVCAALLELLDSGRSSNKAARAGVLVSIAALLHTSGLIVLVLVLPAAMMIQRENRVRVRFVFAALLPVALLSIPITRLGWGYTPFGEWALTVPDPLTALRNMAGNARDLRILSDTYFFSGYLPFFVGALVALSVRSFGTDRRSLLAVAWLAVTLLVVATGFDVAAGTQNFLLGIVLLLGVLLANSGACAIHNAWRGQWSVRWEVGLWGIFLVPAVVGIIRVLIRL